MISSSKFMKTNKNSNCYLDFLNYFCFKSNLKEKILSMNKISLTILASLIFSVTFSQTQIIWTDTLTFNVPATTLQTSAWTAFTASLTPRTYTKVIMRGSFDQIGQSCTDSLVATALANSLYTNTDYISPSTCNGNK